MVTKIFKSIPQEAIDIRTKVFMDEQGFEEEFDAVDDVSVHLVTFDGNLPVATCRIYFDDDKGFIVGRIAVIKEYRGKKIGAEILKEAQSHINLMGGRSIALHAQCRAAEFYEKQGFEQTGEIEYEEYCPHIWMVKSW